jgi:hypothetical protein
MSDATTPSDRDDLHRKAAVAGAVFASLFLGVYWGDVLVHSFPRDRLGAMVGRDFLNVWMAGHALGQGLVGEVFHMVRYNALIASVFGPSPDLYGWSYPPHVFVVLSGFGFLPYPLALALWSALGLAAYLWAALGRGVTIERALLIGFAPAVAIVLFCGQNGLFTAALILGALRFLDSRPLLAGLLLGLLTLKPQLGLLFPLMLVLTGRWRVIASAAATAAALVLASLALVGPEAWEGYVRLAIPMQRDVLATATGLPAVMMPTPYMQARLLGAAPEVAMAAQVPFSLAAVAAVVWTFRRARDPALQAVALLAAGLLVTPYAFNYDMPALVAATAALACARPWPLAAQRLFLLVWASPVLMMLAGFAHLPIATPLLCALLAFALAAMAGDERAARAPSGAAATPA